MVIIPIRIREDVTVQIGDLPADLTPAEARKLCRLIMAYAVDHEVLANEGEV